MGQHGLKLQPHMEERLPRDPELRTSPLPSSTTSLTVFCFQFTERTPGSFVEERDASVVWRFWTGAIAAGPDDTDCADRQWARRQAAEAQNHIFDRFVVALNYLCYISSLLTRMDFV